MFFEGRAGCGLLISAYFDVAGGAGWLRKGLGGCGYFKKNMTRALLKCNGDV